MPVWKITLSSILVAVCALVLTDIWINYLSRNITGKEHSSWNLIWLKGWDILVKLSDGIEEPSLHQATTLFLLLEFMSR